jgi:energy-coupling factor transporter ATP-binding protein EcfA2
MEPTQPLRAVREWLASEYRALLEAELADDPRPDWSAPAWIWTDANLHRIDEVDHARGALLLDPEIGLALAVLAFDEDTRLVTQVGRALAIRSRLVPEAAGRAAGFDARGPWHLALHWLVRQELRDAWLAQAAELRNETSHIEEIPIDYIESGAPPSTATPWRDACARHRFPRLLLATRALFRRPASAVTRWASADERSRDALRTQLRGFTEHGPARVAAELMGWLDARPSAGDALDAAAATPPADPVPAQPVPTPKLVRRLSVANLRNIASLELSFPEETGASVVHGPNGTGKSNLFESLALTLSGASSRYITYLEDRDIATRRSGDNYAGQYLRRWETRDTPQTVMETSTDTKRLELAPDATEARRRLQYFDGTLLGQDQARRFVNMSGDELGALAMGAHSDLAQDLLDHLQARLDEARAHKNALLRRWQLSTQITRLDTATAKIAQGLLSQALGAPQPQVGWLAALPTARLGAAAPFDALNAAWAQWPQRVEQASARVAGSALQGDVAAATDAVIELIHEHHRLLTRTGEALRMLSDTSARLTTEILDRAEHWGQWLEQQATTPPASGASDKAAERGRLQQSLAALRRHGEAMRAHTDHLEAVERFLSQHWEPDHAGQCPTCGTDLQAGYGQDIHQRLASLKASAAEALQAARHQYAEQLKQLKALDEELAQLGAVPCPLDTEQQLQVAEGLALLSARAEDVTALLRDGERRRALLLDARRLIGAPDPPMVSDTPAHELARRTVDSVAEELATIRHALAEPAAWEAVHKAVQQTLSQALQRHLPDTIGRVWFELTMALTPARWQLPCLPELLSEAARRKHRISVRMGEGYARHLLNEAEAHTLGLAWFLQRYLASGRFRYALLALDDPAQEMDQTAYRDLCRLLETLLRLHRIHARPLRLLVLLHQDERALDLVRATDARLLRLGWHRAVPEWLRELRLRAEPARFPLPVMLLESEDTESAMRETT